MKTEADFRKLAAEFDGVAERDAPGALIDLLQTSYEAGAGDEREATIAWIESKKDAWPIAGVVADKLRSFRGWVVK